MWLDVEQNTDDWLILRSGKLTGSAIAKVMANYGKAFGDPAKRLAADIAVEQLTGKPISNGYTNENMQRGHEQEPIARMLYESETFCTVTNGGFFDNGFTGCSPDGLVGKDGIIEIKSVIPSVQYKRVKSMSYDKAYHWQLMDNLRESGRDWIDYVSFCAEFPHDKRLFVQRLHKSDQSEEFKKLEARIAEFKEMVDQAKADIEAFA